MPVNLKRKLSFVLYNVTVVFIRKIVSPLFSRLGYHLLRKSYYLPIPEEGDLIYQTDSKLVGIEMNENVSFDLIDNVLNRYKNEFLSLPVKKTEDPDEFYLLNGSFMAVDGNVYYSLIRQLKPKRIIEIGIGMSSLLASAAIRQNAVEEHAETRLTLIDPYPNKALVGGLAEAAELKVKKIQDIELDFFEALEANDILFIDSSHTLRSGGDVWYEYCEILPRLSSGVYIHIHDISLPNPYPKVYFDSELFWNEQYLLQAFLTYNSRFEVVWGGNYLMTKYPEQMRKAFSPEYDLMRKEYPSSEPSSLWMRVR